MHTPLFSPLAIAPMIDWTNTHFRLFMRILAPKILLYTEMQTSGAIFNNPKRALLFAPKEHPLALQLGGSNAKDLAQCAQIAEEAGFDEINLNLGCPSDRVQAGRFGACLMSEPDLVSECIATLKQSVSIPVTAKTRIGIDKEDSYEFFAAFIHRLVNAGVDKLIVHARKAWLKGLNPKQNRTIPPVNYSYVYQIRREIQSLPIVINGNITSEEEVKAHLQEVEGVMIGRLVCQNPYAISAIHQQVHPEMSVISRSEALEQYLEYLILQHRLGTPLSVLIKPILGLSHGLPGAKAWKQNLVQAQQQDKLKRLQDALVIMREMEAASFAA